MPEYGTEAPLARVKWPTAIEPTVWATAIVGVHVYVPDPLAGIVAVAGSTGAAVDAAASPLIWTLQPVSATFEVPVLVNTTVQTFVDAMQDVTCAVTVAELVNDPKRPNTNPATAMAAMSVIAMRMTVARTGEMAFLFLPCCTIFIVEHERAQFVY